MSNRFDQLIEYCNKTSMSYSYKPVLIMALTDHGGTINIQDAANYFAQYYGHRLTMGLIAERSNSIYSNLDCTFEQIIVNIKSNPVKALLNSDLFVYDKKSDLFGFTADIISSLTVGNKQRIIQSCLSRLDEYYSRIKGQTEQSFVCFHKPEEENGYLSNWYLSNFSFHGLEFTSVEQYMMYRKAIMFDDYSARERILSTNDVAKAKEVGRSVKNYNDKIWAGQRQLIVYQGLLAKFSQDDSLRVKLLNTGSSILAECSLSDQIWGIGLSMNDDCRFLVDHWQGENLLGFSLMQVRNMLQETRSL